ncbi:MAG TPA: FtsX-like permease family protein, partial [Ktedonobacteraceae bacterium]|nr:FtsX-like permease family protein [Ktedonobacteraceae bacterium]
LLRGPRNLAQRLGWSAIGLGWLITGIESKEGFLFAFEPVWNRTPSLFAIVLTMLLPLLGGVIIVMTNADLIIAALSSALRRIRRLAPVSRISLVYPLTFRFRTTVTIALLSLIMVLILLMVTTNLSLLQSMRDQSATGGFSLELLLNNADTQSLGPQLQQLPENLNHEITSIAFLQNSYGVIRSKTKPMLLHLPSHQPEQFNSSWGGPVIADNSFLTNNTLPLLARAQNYATNRQVWDAVRTHTDYALLRYDSSIDGLPANNGFTPFLADVPESDEPTAHYHQVTIVGLLPATSHWDALFISRQTATAIWGGVPDTGGTHCYFQVQQGVSLAQVSLDVNRILHLGERGIALSTLDSSENDVYTTNLTIFLGGYLALGLLFGALSIGVVASRAVVERRQQIGMLRALGFSRTLVGWSFLLETSFVITLSLAIGTTLAGWLAYQALRQGSQNFPIPIIPVVLILLSSYLIVLLCTTLPARKASHLLPAEALRYE